MSSALLWRKTDTPEVLEMVRTAFGHSDRPSTDVVTQDPTVIIFTSDQISEIEQQTYETTRRLALSADAENESGGDI